MTKFLNNADIKGYIAQTAVTSYLLKADSTGRLVAAIAGTDYQAPTTALLPSGGTAGQILAKIDGTNYNTQWIDNFAQQIKYDVKLGAALSKGTPVYVSSANGTNIIVSASSNSTEATSSKTLGLLETGGALNDIVKVVSDGLLSGLNTSTATIGDPVWLGVNGALIFGLANKPSAPAHLVYIGAVTRVHATNGEIFIKVQNGFELDELHNVALSSVADGQGLFYESATSLWKNKTIASVLGYTPANGANYLPLTGGTISGDLTISSTNPRLYFTDTDNNPDYFISNTDGTFTVYDVTNSVGRFKIYSGGNAEFTGSVTTNSTFNITNGLTLFGNHISTQWYNGVDGVFVNYVGYNGGTTQFRNFYVYDGKQGVIATFDGSTKSATFSSSLSATNITLGSGTIGSIPSWMKVITTDATQSGIGAIFNNKALYLYNNGSAIKLDAYDYSTSTALDVQIGGNGGKIILSNGQVRFTTYTSSTSYSGTAAGYLAFDSSGNVITVAGVAATDNTKLPLAGGTTTGIVTFGGSNNSTDNVRFQNTDGNYAYIRQTAASNSNNVWYDGTLGATMWYAWDNPGSARTAGVYTQHIFGTGRGTSNEAVTINRGAISGTNSSGTITYSISRDGDISLGGGSSSVQSTLASGLTAIRFPNQYSSGYTDAGVKLYIFNSGTTIQGFTAGPAYDLQYHSSGSDSGRHAFYVANSEVIRFNKTLVLSAQNFAVGSQQGFDNPGGWNKNILIDGTNHGRFRIKASNYTYGNIDVALWADSSVTPSHGISGSNAVFSFGGTITTLTVGGQTVIHTGNIGSQSVSYASSAGSVAWSNVSSKPDYVMYYQGFTLDANTMGANTTGFTYSNNAPYTGPIARFSETGYSLQLNAAYAGSGTQIAFRTRNGDAGTFNPWRAILNDANYTSYTIPIGGSWGADLTSNGFTRKVGVSYDGGEWVILTANAQISTLIDGTYFAGESGGFYSLNGSNQYSSRVGFNRDGNGYAGFNAIVNAPSGFVSMSNPWGTANSAYFPNGITTAGGQNWIYGATFIGNAPSNGSGVLINSNGSSYFRSNVGTNSHGSSARFHEIQSAAGNFIPYSFESEYGNHSWGTVLRIRINQVGADRPSMQFSYAGTDNRWNVGYCYPDDQFRVTQNMAYRNDNSTSDGWGTERFRINTNGDTYAAIGGTLYANGNQVLTYAGGTLSNNYTFRSNLGGYLGSLSSPPLQVYSESNNSAFMSFHKGGYYAVNFGLDADNVMRIGGWSASANRWQLDMSGNQTIAGDYYGNNHYANGHFRPYGDYGLYSQDYGGVFRRNTNSYGTWESVGYAKNGWGGYVNNNNYIVSWMLNTSGDFGFLTQNGNWWNLFYNNGNNCWGIGTDNTYSGDGFRCIKYGSAQYGWTTWSDRRAKENISTITGALDKVLNMRGVYFNYIIDEAKNKRVGFIAQELQEALPEAVRYAEEIDEYNVEYGQIVSVLAEAVKEHYAKTVAQQIEIDALKTQLQTLLN